MSLLESDEKLAVLKKKLAKYESKMEEVRKLYYTLSEKTNVSKVMEKINKEREKELLEEEKKIVQKMEFEKGQYVYAKRRGCWYTAKVTSVVTRESAFENDYGVTFVGLTQGEENEILTGVVSQRTETLKPYRHPMEYIRKGVRVLAVYESDGKFYPGNIDSLDDHGWVWVKYKGYRGVFKLRLELVRLLGEFGENVYGKEPEEEEAVKAGGGEEKKKSVEKRKRKEDQLLDKRQRKRQKRKEKSEAATKFMEDKKQSWKSFLNKSKSMSMKGVVTSKRPTDIAREKKKKDLAGTRSKAEKVVVKRQTFEAKNVIDEFKTMKEFEGLSSQGRNDRFGGRGRGRGRGRYRRDDGYGRDRRRGDMHRRDDGFNRRRGRGEEGFNRRGRNEGFRRGRDDDYNRRKRY